MNGGSMTDRWTARLSEYLDGDLDAAERAALETHLPGCPECRRTLEALKSVVARASGLDAAGPPSDLWPAIERRIGARGTRAASGSRGSWRGREWAFSTPQLVAAGFLLVVLSGGVVWTAMTVRVGGHAPLAERAATGTSAVPADFGSAKYDAAVAELERVLADHRSELDPSTVRVIEHNLAVIDQATEQARRALAADPANPYLNDHLAEQMRRKVDVLKQATAFVTIHG
jgi:anti-sigma factor RsiW